MSNEIAIIVNGVVPGAQVTYGPRHGENGTGIHYYVTYPNGWRLSIVKAYGTYDIECGIFSPDGDMPDDNGVLDDAVEGWITPERLTEIIAKVAMLPRERQKSIEG
jgi:hypothetical protein